MKIKNLILLFALIGSSGIFSKQLSAQQSHISFQVFYDELSPYGKWVDYPIYGYVWIPDAGTDFIPYSTNGQWIMTDYGWTWVSNYDWGWAPFHYGRWNYDNYYGWFWVPDTEWGPSWVIWRQADGYYGWQPMEPGISISLSFGKNYDSRHDHWIFVRERDFEKPDVNRYNINRTEHERIIRRSTVINRTYVDNRRNTYVSGPAKEDVQRITGTRIRTYAIQENNNPGQRLNANNLVTYRPVVNRGSSGNHKPTPTRITKLKDIKQPSQRNGSNFIQRSNSTDKKSNERQPAYLTPENRSKEKIQPTKISNVIQPANKQNPKTENVTPRDYNREKVRAASPVNANPSENRPVRQPVNNAPRNSNSEKVQPEKTQNINQPANRNNAPTPAESTPEKSNRRTN